MELISNTQRKIIEVFCKTQGKENFYLTGGTALSLFYLKHRKSNDLDFFTQFEEEVPLFTLKLEENLRREDFQVERTKKLASFIELSIQKEEFTIIHIGMDSPFRFEEVKKSSEFPDLKIDSLTDIAVNKLLTLFGRASLRDFIDIFFLIKKQVFSPEELIEKAKIKDPGFDLYWFCVALERIHTFNETSSEMLLLLEKINFPELLTFFDNWRKKLSQSIKD